ncbi:kynurenine 3-monooxygenase-like [Stylophora pistillata]|uniref:kynurenine 3-monooxygenase-like n=1 Tax=Stylophora pistillata TaxID=50429 RepID=UPI000C04C0AD|nr:kynurenine 3-monooxygenase-like [Stylophora pistillata]
MAAKVVQDEKSTKRTVVVGGGLAGALIAVYLAKRGFKVDVFEARKDPRKEVAQRGRSVNLALSVRGIESLRAVGAEGLVTALGIPMHARMIHSHSGNTTPIPYGKKGQHLLSVERQKLNNDLLTVAETYPDVRIHFEHKLIAADIEGGHLTFKCKGNDDEKLEVDAEIILGCDGAYSAVRRELMKRPRFDFSQEYIPHGYKELCLAPTKNGEFAMAVNYLHIWPRQTFMMIALPNQDKSFTCTLFLPFDQFDKLKTKEDVLTFFKAEFPDFLNLMGEEKLLEEFFRNPTGPMVSIKCKPYHVSDKLVIIGDAAHAMVPFYGQGTNCAFEDCLVLNGILEKHNNDFGSALQEYSRTRNKDVESMCDLAMYNYIEMRSLVTSPVFLMKKKLFNFLHWLMPKTFIPLYTMVSFSQIPYKTVIDRSEWQEKVVKRTALMSMLMVGVGGALMALRIVKKDGKLF